MLWNSHAFKIWWDNWKIEKNKYNDIREWWDLAKNKIKLLTMEISRNLNCKQNKKEIDRLERRLDKLKLIANETDEINAQIKQLKGLFCFSQDPTIPVYHCIYFSQFSSYPTKF
jgi:ATP-dependent Lon protease